VGEVLGLDVRAAAILSRLMNDSGESLAADGARLTDDLHAVPWSGGYADEFRRRWHAEARPLLASVVRTLWETGGRLAEHAGAQQAVSDGEDGAGPGGAAVAGLAAAGMLAQGRRPRPQGPPPGPAPAGRPRRVGGPPAPPRAPARNYDLRDGTVHIDDDDQRRAVGRMADAYHRTTGQRITVTDGDRTAAEQADRMADTLDRRARMIYTDRAAAAEVTRAYREASAVPGSTPLSVRAALTDVIRRQMDRGVYVSDHLQGRAVDVRSTGMADPAAFRQAARAEGFRVVDERRGGNPHWHLENDNVGRPQRIPGRQ
jgi:hypothetical protein